MTPHDRRTRELLDRIRAAGLPTDGQQAWCESVAALEDPERRERMIQRQIRALRVSVREQRIRAAIREDPRFPHDWLEVPLHRRLVRRAAHRNEGADLLRSYGAWLEAQEAGEMETPKVPGGYVGLPPAEELFK